MDTQDQEAVTPEMEATPEAVSENTAEAQTQQPEGAEGTDITPEGGEAEPKADAGKSRHQRRKEATERLRAEKEAAEAELAKTNERLAQYEANLSAPRPKEADYQNFEEYQAALAGYEAVRQLDGRQKAEIEQERAAQQREAERIEQQSQMEIAQNWATQSAEAKTRYADFEQVAYTAPISDAVGSIVAQMDEGADVAYHLGMNPQEATRISQLPPVLAAMELGKIEARLSAPKPRTATQAPDPVSPVKAKAAGVKDPDDMSMSEYIAARKAGKI